MIKSLLIANRGEITCRVIRTQFFPGTGRGTASWRWRGRVKAGAHFKVCAMLQPAPPSGYACHLPVPGRIL